MTKHLFIALACTAMTAWTLTAQNVEQSALGNVQKAVRFEVSQKEKLTLKALELDTTFQQLARMSVSDDQILQAFKLHLELEALVQNLKDTNSRQAALAEQITRRTQDKQLSNQEDSVYRECAKELTTLAHTQNKLLKIAEQKCKIIKNYLAKLPPPTTLKLNDILEFRLVRANGIAFYMSAPLPHDLPELPQEIKRNESMGIINPTWFQARKITAWATRTTMVPLKMPNQLQLNVMARAKVTLPCAIWTDEVFDARNSLAYSRKLHRVEKLEKMPLTPAQRTATAQFNIDFMLLWDPQHLLGTHDIIRELPQACHPVLGMVLVAPISIGSQQRFNALQKKFRQDYSRKLEARTQK